MNKNQLELERLKISAHRTGAVLNFLKSLAQLACIYFCATSLFDMLKAVVSANPAGITALAELVKNMNLGTITAYIVAVGTTTGWLVERRGKKRLIRGYSNGRNEIESADAYNGSSGLTPTGDTPS